MNRIKNTLSVAFGLALCATTFGLAGCYVEPTEADEARVAPPDVEPEYYGQTCDKRIFPNGGCSGFPGPGTCCANPGQQIGECVNLLEDDSNCGQCNHTCGLDAYCENGECIQ